MTHNQTAEILSHLKKNGSIEPMDALAQFGSFRLAARIYDLRTQGYQIETVRVQAESGKKYARYVYRGESLRTSAN